MALMAPKQNNDYKCNQCNGNDGYRWKARVRARRQGEAAGGGWV
jgi:hypothetical protein